MKNKIHYQLLISYISYILLFFFFFLLSPSYATQPQDVFSNLADKFYSTYYSYNPTQGTLAGFHQYDALLENYSQTNIQKMVTSYKHLLHQFEQVQVNTLTTQQVADRDQIIAIIHSQLLELEEIKMWEKNPDLYSSTMVANSVFLLISRNFAPLDNRLKSTIAREKQVVAALESAKNNLKNPPRIYTEV